MRGRKESLDSYVLESPFMSSETINLRKKNVVSMRSSCYAPTLVSPGLKESKFS